MNEQKPQLFDSKTLIALALTGVVFMGWQFYMSKKYPESSRPQEASSSREAQNPNTSSNANATTAQEIAIPTEGASLAGSSQTQVEARSVLPEKVLTFSNDKVSFQISNNGFGIRNFQIKSYLNESKEPITLGKGNIGDLFTVFHGDRIVTFEIAETSPGLFEGTAQIGETRIKRTLKMEESSYAFTSQLQVTSASEEFLKTPLQVKIPDQIHIAKSTSIFFPSFNHQDFIHIGFDKPVLTNIDREEENILQDHNVVRMVGIGTQYFVVAALDKSFVSPSLKLKSDRRIETATATLNYGEIRGRSEFVLENIFYVGPKSYDILKALDESFIELMDYGMFGFIAKPMLLSMKWFHSLVGNWGFAIILLTILVRIVVLPLYLMSVRSMKGMQKIQPRMKELQQRYKDDPMTMNKEVWALMKSEKASPFGGCLPMLLQIPIFFALYRVISTSIELHQSPFFLWIQDLSAYDHFFVLPILMGLTMFIQQKITPTNMDPAQAKILLYMPLIFTVFMVSLPSGLTLYMFISSLFGILQQLILVPPVKAQNS